jgi:hypothetical protein
MQEAGFLRHDAPLAAWLDGFLDHWLGCRAGFRAATTSRPTLAPQSAAGQ